MNAQQSQTKMPRSVRCRAILIRVVMFGMVAASIVLLSRSINRALASAQQARGIGDKLVKVESETESLRKRWTDEQVEELEEQFSKLPSVIFPEHDAVGDWLRDLRSRAEFLALDPKVEFGTATMPVIKDSGVVTVPVTITVQIKAGEPSAPPRSAYHRLMFLLSHLVSHPRRADVVGIEVLGNSNSITKAVATVNLWASESTM